MKFFNFLLVAAFGLMIVNACNSTKTAGKVSLKNEVDSLSYSIGVNIGAGMREQGISDVNPEVFAAAVAQAIKSDSNLSINPEAAGAYIQGYMQKAAKSKGAASIKKGQDFLAANKTKAGVQTTASGLQYKIITAGTGAKPLATETVRVNYKGTLIDGKVFDQSQPGQPAEFAVNQLIPAWTEALQMMPAGSKWQIFVPSNLAYGERGAGGAIGPNETLVFDMELIEIVKGGAAAPEKK